MNRYLSGLHKRGKEHLTSVLKPSGGTEQLGSLFVEKRIGG